VYGLPENYDLGFFIGAELDAIQLGKHQVQLGFRGGQIRVSVESGLRWNGAAVAVGDAHRLHVLLEETVVDARRESRGDLALTLSNGDALVVVEDPDLRYESYSIERVREATLIV
jgi:hypothetical protein